MEGDGEEGGWKKWGCRNDGWVIEVDGMGS